MTVMRVPVTDAEVVALIEHTRGNGLHVSMELGTGRLRLDLSKANDRAIGEALVAMRTAAQNDKDRVGDPR